MLLFFFFIHFFLSFHYLSVYTENFARIFSGYIGARILEHATLMDDELRYCMAEYLAYYFFYSFPEHRSAAVRDILMTLDRITEQVSA